MTFDLAPFFFKTKLKMKDEDERKRQQRRLNQRFCSFHQRALIFPLESHSTGWIKDILTKWKWKIKHNKDKNDFPPAQKPILSPGDVPAPSHHSWWRWVVRTPEELLGARRQTPPPQRGVGTTRRGSYCQNSEQGRSNERQQRIQSSASTFGRRCASRLLDDSEHIKAIIDLSCHPTFIDYR